MGCALRLRPNSRSPKQYYTHMLVLSHPPPMAEFLGGDHASDHGLRTVAARATLSATSDAVWLCSIVHNMSE